MDCTPTDAPPRPRKLKVRLDDVADGFAFRLRNPQIVASAFLFLWLIGWTVGCVYLALDAWKNPQLSILLFGIPFWSSWFFVAGLIVYNYTLYESFQLDREGVMFYRQAVIVVLRREVPLAEILEFVPYEDVRQSDGSTSTTYGIELRGLGRHLRFAANLPEAERTWLVYELQEALQSLQADDHLGSARASIDRGSDVSLQESKIGPDRLLPESDVTPQELLVAPASTPLRPPSDTTWHLIDDFDAVNFAERGRMNVTLLVGLTFICAFWNGIVSTFVCTLWGVIPGAPQPGLEWWGMFFFLIPFEVIGLCMLAALLLALMEPLRTTCWSFSPDHVRCRIAWLGALGWSWHYPVYGYGSLKILDDQPGLKHFLPKSASDETGSRSALVVVDEDNTEVCTVSDLSLGEARWMGDVLLRYHPEWFPRQGT